MGEVIELKRARTRHALAAAALILALAAPPAFAEDDRVASPDDWVRAAHYITCTLAVAGAATPLSLAGAMIGCLLLLRTDP
jgi:hypothetical protein